MKRQLLILVVAAALLQCALARAESLSVKVVVKLRDRVEDKVGKPFVDVGGFALRRNNAIYTAAKCPDVSNARGEFACKLECESTDGDMRLHLVSPAREQARIVAGLSPPDVEAVEVSRCKVTTKLPIEIVYRTLDVMLAEVLASSPQVFDAVTASGSGKSTTFKPFPAAADSLLGMAKNSQNRSAMLEFSKFATAFEEAPPERRPAGMLGNDLSQYTNGVNSVVLKAIVEELAGSKLSAQVKVSGSLADFSRSITAVERNLDAKPLLNEQEIYLSNSVRNIKAQPKRATDNLQKMTQ